MDDPDLLYEDLFEDLEDGKAIIKTSLHEMEDRMKCLSNEAEELRLQVRKLQDQNDGLCKQNEVLIRNISCLFKTAQMEISRKDKQIRSLQEVSLKMNAFNHGSPASTAGMQAAADRRKPHPTVVLSQADCKDKTGETCTASGAMGKRGLHGGKHGEYATMMSRGGSKDKAGETSLPLSGTIKESRNGEYAAMPSSEDCNGRMGGTNFASNGVWKQNNHDGAHCDRVAVALRSDCKGDMGETPLTSDSMRRRGEYRSGHRDYATIASQANHKGRMEETPVASGGTEKQSHCEREHCHYAIKASQADYNGSIGGSPLASDGIGKQGRYWKCADLEGQGGCKGRVKVTSPGPGCTGKLGHYGDNTAMASRADCKGSEKETVSTLSGMENPGHHRADHRDCAEKRRSCGKGSEVQDEARKRRRREGEYVATGKECQRRRADERYALDAKREEGAMNAD